jgi:cytochrome d ubiquinol oxidase subunit II
VRVHRDRYFRRLQAFLLIGTLFLLPIILVYSSWSYWVFRGKVRADVRYH